MEVTICCMDGGGRIDSLLGLWPWPAGGVDLNPEKDLTIPTHVTTVGWMGWC